MQVIEEKKIEQGVTKTRHTLRRMDTQDKVSESSYDLTPKGAQPSQNDGRPEVNTV